ncbi:uncharacterized protein LOC110025159 [Phalaenopsis equestris]|uniref:uncharacterized protein LOC110025159 n=1 Tax=Phalaenopsis equestris TaxID=78828 RepID=UPI0009E1D10F|nr:uncharacterized protein LOC110025159 [Phalaenopsis equestris]XP_020581120.1 uncharacterized protein LOC110025159 [Phalaenopsis equestris]XP_020581121.1 uncharacterized protein LOC110025159 [Phalaenopsis equestris]
MEEIKGSTSTNSDIVTAQKEWDEICCPICLDHPHNAVLLICRSHEKGCRAFICDTSYRHSNCLDRFKKLKLNQGDTSFLSSQQHYQNDQIHVENPNRIVTSGPESMAESDSVWSCPLCRETVSGWMIVKETRQYLDLKPRSCSRELCSFSGNYMELRRHARRVHPATRPSDVDPSRQRAWRRLENEREHGDILSAIRSAMPGAIVIGDYVIDRSNDPPREAELGEDGGSWLTTFFLLRMMNGGLIGFLDEPRGSSGIWRRMSRRPYGRHERSDRNLLDLQGGGDEDDLNPDGDSMIPRRRRRLTRSRHGEEQRNRMNEEDC